MRVRLPKAAAAELATRYRARAEAERRLADYLMGVVLTKGIALDQLDGFDDETGELILLDAPASEEESADRPPP